MLESEVRTWDLCCSISTLACKARACVSRSHCAHTSRFLLRPSELVWSRWSLATNPSPSSSFFFSLRGVQGSDTVPLLLTCNAAIGVRIEISSQASAIRQGHHAEYQIAAQQHVNVFKNTLCGSHTRVFSRINWTVLTRALLPFLKKSLWACPFYSRCTSHQRV